MGMSVPITDVACERQMRHCDNIGNSNAVDVSWQWEWTSGSGKARSLRSLTHEDDEDAADTETKVVSVVIEGTCVRRGVRRGVRHGRVVHRGEAGDGRSEGEARVEAWMVSPRTTSRRWMCGDKQGWDGCGWDECGWGIIGCRSSGSFCLVLARCPDRSVATVQVLSVDGGCGSDEIETERRIQGSLTLLTVSSSSPRRWLDYCSQCLNVVSILFHQRTRPGEDPTGHNHK
jgi:hypothetical protein